jgi:hypothetical protein
MNEIEKMVRELDKLVTGKEPTGRPADFDVDEWIFFGDTFYCSDGGYSRLFFSVDKGCVCLDSVSTDHSKMRWQDEHVRELRQAIESVARSIVLANDPSWEFEVFDCLEK